MFSVQIEGEKGPVTLVDELDSGTDGTVYNHPSVTGQLVKIWHDPTDAKCKKLEAILNSPPVVPGGLTQIARPLKHVTLVPRSQVVGFTMSRASGNPLADIANLASRPLAFQSYKRRLQLVGKLAKSIEKLNGQGHILLDGIDPQNVFAGPELWFLDVDGWQISANGTSYPAEAVHAEICPPELMGLEICTATLNGRHDAWVLGTDIVWLLTGHHPFAAKLNSPTGPELEDRIANGLWPHARRARRHGVRPHPAAPLELLHPAMRRLAVECFDSGSLDATARPRATEWTAAIQKALADKPFLNQITGIEAVAVRKRVASLNGSPAGKKLRSTGRRTPQRKKRPRVKLAMSATTVVLVTTIGVGYYADVNRNKPQLVAPTGVVYEGEPRPTPELSKSALLSLDAAANPRVSRRRRKSGPHKSTPATWRRLQQSN